MPVRTATRRAALTRAVAGWPLRSPRHAALTVLLGLGLAVGTGTMLNATSTEPAPPPPRPAAGRPALAPPPARTAPGQLPMGEQAVVRALATTAAQRWITHPPGMTPAAWAEQFRPIATPELVTTLTGTDSARVTATRASTPQLLTTHPALVTVDVPTDTTGLRMGIARTRQGWRVHTIEPNTAEGAPR